MLTANSIQFVCNVTGLQSVAWFVPMAVGGLVLATVSGFTLHLLPGKVALIVSSLGYLLSAVLFATIPHDNTNYWAFIFPAMIGATLGVDITYGVSNIFITTSLPKRRQGLAGAVINSVLFLGMSFFLGIADMVESVQKTDGTYKAAFWVASGSAVVSLVVISMFVRIGKARSELTIDERADRMIREADRA
jgi:MFS family permease